MKAWATGVNVGSAVIEKDGKFLLVQEAVGPPKGTWNFPGGRQDPGETIQQTAIREAKEESGFEVVIEKLLVKAERSTINTTLNAFEVKVIGGKLSFPREEILDAKWFTYEEIVAMEDQLRDAEYILSALKANQL